LQNTAPHILPGYTASHQAHILPGYTASHKAHILPGYTASHQAHILPGYIASHQEKIDLPKYIRVNRTYLVNLFQHKIPKLLSAGLTS
jgi:hypothetical protein